MKLLNLKKRYPFKCPCGHTGECAPSIMQDCFQINHGGVHCPKCNKTILVRIDSKNIKMVVSGRKSDFGRLPQSCYRDATEEEEKEILNANKQHAKQ